MKNTPSTLYAIQSYEIAIDKARERLQEIEAALAHDEQVATSQAAFDDSEQTLHQLRTQVKDLELENASLQEKIEAVDKLLYSGKITNPKELQERQSELESLRRRQVILEERLQETISAAEDQQIAHEQASQDLQEALANREQSHVDLIAEQERLNAEIQENLLERKTIVDRVPKDLLKQYRSLRKRKAGQAVALLKDKQCMSCGIEQPSSDVQRVMHDDELIYCVGCGRILTSH